MYPSKKTEAQFQTYLNKRHKQLRSSIIDDRHFSLVIPNGFYLKDLIWTHDRNLAQYQLMSKNQNVSININTSQSLGPQISQYQELKQKIIKDAQEYFDDVSYTQYAHKNHIYNQLIAKGTESDKFTATANTFIFKDQSYGINIHVNGKTFDKNFQKGIDIAKSINIKHTDHIKSS